MTRITPSELDAATLSFVATLAAGALSRSPFAAMKHWPLAVLVMRAGETRVTGRADLASWFRANDLGDLAVECGSARVAPGELLVWIDYDIPTACGASALPALGFVVLDLRQVMAAAARVVDARRPAVAR